MKGIVTVNFTKFFGLFSGVHKLKSKLVPRDKKKSKAQPVDPIPPIAEEISEESWLLCFDEFQVRRQCESEENVKHKDSNLPCVKLATLITTVTSRLWTTLESRKDEGTAQT